MDHIAQHLVSLHVMWLTVDILVLVLVQENAMALVKEHVLVIATLRACLKMQMEDIVPLRPKLITNHLHLKARVQTVAILVRQHVNLDAKRRVKGAVEGIVNQVVRVNATKDVGIRVTMDAQGAVTRDVKEIVRVGVLAPAKQDVQVVPAHAVLDATRHVIVRVREVA